MLFVFIAFGLVGVGITAAIRGLERYREKKSISAVPRADTALNSVTGVSESQQAHDAIHKPSNLTTTVRPGHVSPKVEPVVPMKAERPVPTPQRTIAPSPSKCREADLSNCGPVEISDLITNRTAEAKELLDDLGKTESNDRQNPSGDMDALIQMRVGIFQRAIDPKILPALRDLEISALGHLRENVKEDLYEQIMTEEHSAPNHQSSSAYVSYVAYMNRLAQKLKDENPSK